MIEFWTWINLWCLGILFTKITHLIRNRSSLLIWCSFHPTARYLIYVFPLLGNQYFILPFLLKLWHLYIIKSSHFIFLGGFVTCSSSYSHFLWFDFHFNMDKPRTFSFLNFINSSQFRKSQACQAGTPHESASHYHRISLSSHEVLYCSIFQRDGSHCTALTICYKQAAPGILWGQRKTWRLGKTGFVRIWVISILFISTSSKPKAGSFF